MSATGWPVAAQTHLAARNPIAPRWLLWLGVRDGSGNPVTAGFWTGEQDATLTVEGQPRLYRGTQGALTIPPIRYVTGTEVQSLEVALSVTAEAETVARSYLTRFGTAEIHCALYNPATWGLLGVRRFWRGFIDGQPIVTPEVGGEARIGLRLVSSARKGTMTKNGKKSDASQQERYPGDKFRAYADLGQVASDPWGKR